MITGPLSLAEVLNHLGATDWKSPERLPPFRAMINGKEVPAGAKVSLKNLELADATGLRYLEALKAGGVELVSAPHGLIRVANLVNSSLFN